MDQIRKLLVATYGRRKIISQNQLHYLGWFSCFGLNYKCLNKLKPHGYFPKTDLLKFSSGHKVCIGYFFQYLPSSSLTTHNTIGYTLYPRPWNMNITIKSYSQGFLANRATSGIHFASAFLFSVTSISIISGLSNFFSPFKQDKNNVII